MNLPWRSVRPAHRRRASAAVGLLALGLLALAGFGTIVITTGSSSAETGPLTGLAVPTEYREAFVQAAKSCPALTPARLAGQVMEESRFSPTATNDRNGRGLAGMTDEAWKVWQPWSDASRTDPKANIVALAHQLCDLIGQVRVAELAGNPWELAVAAYHSGMAKVREAKGVPAAARAYVDRVMGYAEWYGFQTDLLGPPAPTSTSAPTADLASPSPTTPAPTDSATATTAPPTTDATTSTAPATPRSTPTTPPPLTRGELWNDEYHGCLSASKALDGTQLVIAGCDGSMVQHWQAMSDGTIRSVGLCMDAANAGTTDFTRVQVANCSGNPAQLFTLNDNKQLYSPYANKCVNIHYTPGQGTSVVLFSCLNQPNQFFAFRAQ